MAVTPKAAGLDGRRLPADLADLASPVWRDVELFIAWLDVHLAANLQPPNDVRERLEFQTWPGRYAYAIQHWAMGAGILSKGSIDGKRVRELGGFLPVPAIVRAMDRAGQDFHTSPLMMAAAHKAKRALDERSAVAGPR